MAWFAHAVALVQVTWLLGTCAIVIPRIIWDEIRFKRSAPKPAEVTACVDQFESVHGSDALGGVGEALYAACKTGDFRTRRLLKEVSEELVRRRVERQARS